MSRELIRLDNVTGLARLQAFVTAVPDRYLPLTDSALKRAATLWAHARNIGIPTADNRELDCDVILAAQALDLGLASTEFVIATSNIGHLSRFVPADLWANIAA